MKKELKDKYVYLHRDVNNTIFYVGVGGKSRPRNTQKRSGEWKAIAKDGYSIDIHKKEITLSDAFEIEIDLIELIGRRDLNLGTLVNKTNGGVGTRGALRGGSLNGMYGKKHSKKSIEEMKLSHKGAQTGPLNNQFGNTGDSNHNFGRKLSEEHRKKISESNFGKPKSKEAKEKMRKAKLGKPLSDSHKKNMSITRRRKSFSDDNYNKITSELLNTNYVKGVTYKEFAKRYGVEWYVISRLYRKIQKNK